MEWLEGTWQVIDEVSTFAGFVAALFAILTWLKTTELIRRNREAKDRARAPISIILRMSPNSSPPREILIPYKPRRDHLSRAELVGILGQYYGKDRFDSDILCGVLEDGSLNRVLAGEAIGPRDATLYIECPQAVFEKFESAISKKRLIRESADSTGIEPLEAASLRAGTAVN